MTSTTQKKSDRTRARILQESLILFQERGFENTTMRAIAEASGLSLGAAYYYFKTKEDLVLHYYTESAREMETQCGTIRETSQDFKDRFRALLDAKHQQLLPVRTFIGVLVRQAGELKHPLSPFSTETRSLREEAIGQIESLIEGSSLRVSRVLRPQLAKLFWVYQLGIVLFWINDPSKEQARTQQLIGLSLDLVLGLLKLTTLPMMGRLNESVLQVIRLVESCTASDNQEERVDA